MRLVEDDPAAHGSGHAADDDDQPDPAGVHFGILPYMTRETRLVSGN